jgi:hypothetical protein
MLRVLFRRLSGMVVLASRILRLPGRRGDMLVLIGRLRERRRRPSQ